MGKINPFFTAAGLALALLALPLCAQFEAAEVLGTVRDKTGGSISKATVTLTNQNTGIVARTTTDDDGSYDFLNVQVGRYSVTMEAPGFAKISATDIGVAVNARQRVDIVMQVGAATETVEVTGAAATLDTDTSEHGQVINRDQVVELPLNGRNYSDLALLATNVRKSVIGAAGITGTPREGSFNANGMRSTYNNFLLDGVDNNAYSTSNQGFSNQVAQPSPDSVQEFKVITENYSAEYGRVGGAVVNVVMRSGTNRLHGTAYDFLRNTDLNAVGYLFGKPLVFVKPPLQRNQFGLTVGGPIIKNKLFFFGDYEGYRSVQKTLVFDQIPTLAMQQGILPNTVVNPMTGAIYGANTPIPASAISPVAASIIKYLPAPTNPGLANNYEPLLATRDYADKYDAKIDYHMSDRLSGSLRFSQRKDNQYYQPDIQTFAGGGGNGYVRSLSQNAAMGIAWTATSSSLLEVRLGFSHILGGKFPVFLGGPSAQELFGITGISTSPNLTGGLNTQNISGGFLGLGRQATNPQFQNPTSWDPVGNYSWNRGRHAFKFGAEGGIIHTQVMDINPVYGLNAYAGQFSKPSCAQLGLAAGCAVPADTATYDFADFLFGLPSQIQLSNYLIGNYRQRQLFLYAQDDFRVTSKLTLNVGLRWEYTTPRWERDNVLSNFDPATNSILHASDGSIYNRSLVHPDYKNFGPRLGFAWSAMPKTVLRGGYGISYVHLNRLGSADELGINGPQVNQLTLNQSLTNGQLPPGFITSAGFPPNSSANFVPVNANIAYIPADTRWPMVQTWFFAAQRELMSNTVFELTYSGNHSTNLPIIADYNQAVPNQPGGTLGIQARRPNQSFGAITWVDPAGQQSYNALSARFEHRLSHGLYLLNSFTWSKALGNSEQALEYASGYYAANPQNIYNLAAERGPSSFDQKFINVTSVVYQLPFGKGRQFGSHWNGLTDSILGGWQVNTINTANTGLPLDIAYTPTAANDVTGRIPDYRGEAIMRPNLIGNPTGTGVDSSGTPFYLSGAAFQIPSAGAPFGNVGRNSLRGPGFWQWDLGVTKNFAIPAREGMAVQFRSEFFNVLNHTNFGFPDSNISDAAFGTIRTTFPSRQIQMALKLMF